jgi:TonB family protein
MKPTREEIYGYTGSGIFCLLVVLLLFLIVLKTTVQTEEAGVLVSFGNVDLASGTFEPRRGEPRTNINTEQPVIRQETPPVTQQRPQYTPPVVTQNVENTAAIEAARREQEERERIEIEQRAQRAREEEERRRREAINQQVSGAFGASATAQNQQGGATGSGVEGNPQGTSSVGSPSGGGFGEFSLTGRSLAGNGRLPHPGDNGQIAGRIVITITVNPNGDVMFAEIGRGTDIDNAAMRRAALEAARRAKFNGISGTNNQTGTITYRYVLN